MKDTATAAPVHSSDELYANVKAWLSKEGYPLELKVARAFGRSDWDYALGQRFSDPMTGVLREVDIVASRMSVMGTRNWWVSVRISLVIECKSSGDRKPWVVFGADPSDDYNVSSDIPFDFDLVPAGPLGEKALALFWKLGAKGAITETDDEDIHGLRALSIYGRNPGSAVVEAFRKASDNAFAAVMGATSAAVALARDRAEHITANKMIHVHLFVPVTVVEAPVFRFWVTLDGHEHLEDVGITSVLVDHAGSGGRSGQPRLGAHIVSFDHLSVFVERVTKDADRFIKVLVGSTAAARRLHAQLRTP